MGFGADVDARPAYVVVTGSPPAHARLRETHDLRFVTTGLTAAVDAARQAAGGRDVFVYFISGAKVRNPAAAQALIERLR